MPLSFTIHPCSTARQRQEACRIERKLDLRRQAISFNEATDRLRALVPGLRLSAEHARTVELITHRDEHDRPSATVFELGRPFVTITHRSE